MPRPVSSLPYVVPDRPAAHAERQGTTFEIARCDINELAVGPSEKHMVVGIVFRQYTAIPGE